MSWDKPVRGDDVRRIPGSMEVEKYIYTPGIHGLELSKALIQGKILGMKCGDEVFVPPLTYCQDHRQGDLVEVNGPWTVETYTVVYEDLYGRRLKEPQIIAVVRPKEARGGIIHYIKTDPEKIKLGMKVKPVFKVDRRGVITDIEYFKPVEEE